MYTTNKGHIVTYHNRNLRGGLIKYWPLSLNGYLWEVMGKIFHPLEFMVCNYSAVAQFQRWFTELSTKVYASTDIITHRKY